MKPPAYVTRPRPKPSARSTAAAPSRHRARTLDDRHKVLHDYHDHAGVPFPSSSGGRSKEVDAEPSRRGPRGGVTVPFPTKLHVMLSKVEEEGLADIVSWQPHGRCFVVRQPKEFVSKVMPLYFRQSKLTSFQRQLNLYGFIRITAGRDRGGYYHELFLRHKLFLCEKMHRIRIKGTGIKGRASPESEPDFYSMPPIAAPGPSLAQNRDLEDEMAAYIENELERFGPAKRQSSKKRSPTKRSSSRKKKDAAPKKLKVELPEDDGYIYSGYSDHSSPRDAPSPPPAMVTPDAGQKESVFRESAVRRLSQQTFADLCPPSLSLDSEDAVEPHSGDDLVFEGQHFHYIDSLVTRPPRVALEPRKRATDPRPFHTLLSSISESSLSVAKSLREPILTPSTSSSSLGRFRPDESLDINPDTIFSEKEDGEGGGDWAVGGEGIDDSVDLDPWERYIK